MSCILTILGVHSAAGSSAPGPWQATWQYLACLLRSGELYEQLGAWEDALLAFKEGLLMVRSPIGILLLSIQWWQVLQALA